jgi:hypothetical protein
MNGTEFKSMTVEQLTTLKSEIEQELASRTLPIQSVRVSVRFGGCNERRYGKGWIGRIISWPVGGKPEIEWGSFIGDVGSGGEAEIMAKPGDIVRWGQKDHRGNNTEASWGKVETDGSIITLDATEARAAYKGK